MAQTATQPDARVSFGPDGEGSQSAVKADASVVVDSAEAGTDRPVSELASGMGHTAPLPGQPEHKEAQVRRTHETIIQDTQVILVCNTLNLVLLRSCYWHQYRTPFTYLTAPSTKTCSLGSRVALYLALL